MTPRVSQGLFGGSSIQVHSGQVAAVFHFHNLDQGIVDTFRAFDRQLWFGHMHRDTFLYSHYLHAKHNSMAALCDIDQQSDAQKRALAFSLYLLRSSLNQRWRWPALLNRNPMGIIDQRTGNTRAFASIMLHEKPWENYPILLAEHRDFDVTQVLHDPVLISSDQQLNEIVGVPYDDSLWDPQVYIYVRMLPAGDLIYPCLDYIGDGTYHDHNPIAGQQILENYAAWRRTYGRPVPLAIYTQWPELIRNQHRMWDVEIVGTTEGMLIDERRGYAERTVLQYHACPVHEQKHVLWVVEPRMIDLVDLLCWMDMTHSTYIGQDWDFLLYRQQPEYKNTFIQVSRCRD